MLIDGDSADVAVAKIESMPKRAAHGFQGANALLSHFRTNAVAT
jgi:hypothetical protein